MTNLTYHTSTSCQGNDSFRQLIKSFDAPLLSGIGQQRNEAAKASCGEQSQLAIAHFPAQKLSIRAGFVLLSHSISVIMSS